MLLRVSVHVSAYAKKGVCMFLNVSYSRIEEPLRNAHHKCKVFVCA